MKKMAKVMVLVLALCLVVPSMCFAAVAVAAATVVRTGQTTSGGYVMLTDTARPTRNLRIGGSSAPPAVGNGQLATALTAMSLGKTVQVGLASTTQYALINYIYVNP